MCDHVRDFRSKVCPPSRCDLLCAFAIIIGVGKSWRRARGHSFDIGRRAARGAEFPAVDLESGRFALVERWRAFTLAPSRDMLDRHVDKAASGSPRADGISWQFRQGEGADPLLKREHKGNDFVLKALLSA